MDGVLVLVGLLVLAIPAAIVYLLIAFRSMQQRMNDLETMLAFAVGKGGADLSGAMSQAPKPAKMSPLEKSPAPVADKDHDADINAKPAAKPPPAALPGPPPQNTKVPGKLHHFVIWLMSHWFYAVSAASLALAGLFLVQYGIENALFPPVARVVAALGFGGALIAAGEWIRRRFGDGLDATTAYIPSVFAGAGVVSLFGAIASARLLYELIGVEVAFAGLAAVGVLGVALGWLYGPLMAAIGVLGAFAAPLLVGSSAPATSWLFLYFAVIAAVGLGIDTIRRWAWVSVLSVVLAFVTGALSLLGGGIALILGFQIYMVALVFMAVLIPARSLKPDHAGPFLMQLFQMPREIAGFPTWLAAMTVAGATVGLVLTGIGDAEHFWISVVGLLILFAAQTYWSVSGPSLQDVALLPAIAVIVLVGVTGREGSAAFSAFSTWYEDNPEADFPLSVTWLWAAGLGLSVVAARRAWRPGLGIVWGCIAALAAPVMAIVIEVTWRPATVIGSYPWALHAIALATVMVMFALKFAKSDGADRARVSLFVLSALSAISFAFVLILSLAALTVSLSVTVVVAAWLDRQFRLPLMQIFIGVGVVVVGVRLVGDPGLGWALEAKLWEICLAYGGAVGAFVAALSLVPNEGRTFARVMLDTAAWSSLGIFLSLLLYRALDSVLQAGGPFTHWGMGLFACIWFALMYAQILRLETLRGWMTWVRGLVAALFGVLGCTTLLLGMTALSPLFGNWGAEVIGLPIVNTLLPAYACPAVLLAVGALGVRHRRMRLLLFGLAGGVAAVWGFATIRHVWQGAGTMPLWHGYVQPELYSYTVVLLLVGAVLFFQALARNAVGLRRAGLCVIGLAAAKVFFVDISGLDGLLRVFSLAMLGIALAGLAWLDRWAQAGVQQD